jgi:hypothetical protein
MVISSIGFSRRHHAVDRRRIGDIGDHADGLATPGRDLGRDGVRLGLVGPRIDDDRRAVLGQHQRDGAPDIAPGAGHQRDAAGEELGGGVHFIIPHSSPSCPAQADDQ